MNMLQTNKEINFKFVLSMAAPIFFEQALRILLGNVDQWMVNNFSSTAVAAIGNANQIINMGIIVLDMICVAATIILAQHIGAKSQKNVESIFTLCIGLIGVLSIIISIVLVAFRKSFFSAMNIPAELLPDTQAYLIIVGAGLCIQGFFMAISAIFRSFAMMKEIMAVSFFIKKVTHIK